MRRFVVTALMLLALPFTLRAADPPDRAWTDVFGSTTEDWGSTLR